MIPAVVMLIPNFVLIRSLGWLNTFQGIVAPAFLMTPFSVFFFRQFFLGINREIEESAKLDGASLFGIFIKIVVPMQERAADCHPGHPRFPDPLERLPLAATHRQGRTCACAHCCAGHLPDADTTRGARFRPPDGRRRRQHDPHHDPILRLWPQGHRLHSVQRHQMSTDFSQLVKRMERIGYYGKDLHSVRGWSWLRRGIEHCSPGCFGFDMNWRQSPISGPRRARRRATTAPASAPSPTIGRCLNMRPPTSSASRPGRRRTWRSHETPSNCR